MYYKRLLQFRRRYKELYKRHRTSLTFLLLPIIMPQIPTWRRQLLGRGSECPHTLEVVQLIWETRYQRSRHVTSNFTIVDRVIFTTVQIYPINVHFITFVVDRVVIRISFSIDNDININLRKRQARWYKSLIDKNKKNQYKRVYRKRKVYWSRK